MGFYIQTRVPIGKVEQLEHLYNAVVIDQPRLFTDVPPNKALLCCVDNNAFEAVGFAFSEQEFKAFSNMNDRRRKTWLLMDYDTVCKLTGYQKK